jgi:hypothetical protein
MLDAVSDPFAVPTAGDVTGDSTGQWRGLHSFTAYKNYFLWLSHLFRATCTYDHWL